MLTHSLLQLATMFLLFPAPRDPEPDERGQGFFGVRMVDTDGITVTQVVSGGPAEKAGVRLNDIIVAINSTKVPTVNDAREVIARLRPGSIAQIEVRRGEKPVLIKVKVGSRSEIMP